MDNRTNQHPERTTKDSSPHDGFTMLNIGGSQAQGSTTVAQQYITQSLSGANWFLWIAGLSLINSIILLANGNWSFLAGLGTTQLIDALARVLADQIGNTAIALAGLLDIVAASVFVVFGLLARKRQVWAFVVGMCLYALDGLIFLLVQDWLSIAFHLFALYCIYKGLSATNKLRELGAATAIEQQIA